MHVLCLYIIYIYIYIHSHINKYVITSMNIHTHFTYIYKHIAHKYIHTLHSYTHTHGRDTHCPGPGILLALYIFHSTSLFGLLVLNLPVTCFLSSGLYCPGPGVCDAR